MFEPQFRLWKPLLGVAPSLPVPPLIPGSLTTFVGLSPKVGFLLGWVNLRTNPLVQNVVATHRLSSTFSGHHVTFFIEAL